MLPLPFPASTISLPYGAVDDEYYFPWAPHMGTDFSSRSQGVTAGSAIRASGAGRVVRAGVGPAGVSPNITRPNSLAGNSVDVDYGDFIARYMHRPYNSPSPKAGDRVSEGTVLGVIGNTGLSGGAHLHMETWDKATGRRVNPANYFDFTRTVTSGSGAAGDARPFNPDSQEDDMYDTAAEKRLMDKLDEIHRAAAPLKIYTYGTGLVLVNPLTKGWEILAQGYPELLRSLGLVGPGGPSLNDAQFGYVTQHVPAAVGILPIADAGLTDEDVSKIKSAIDGGKVTLSQAQLDALTAAVAKGARDGGEAGARAAVENLTLVVKAD